MFLPRVTAGGYSTGAKRQEVLVKRGESRGLGEELLSEEEILEDREGCSNPGVP